MEMSVHDNMTDISSYFMYMREMIFMKCILLIVVVLTILSGCNHNNDDAVTQYLKNKGYQVVSTKGQVETYVLTKQKLLEMPYMIYWGLQSVDPSAYISKTITVKKYIVKNHPLSNDRVDVIVFIADGQPIGGVSNRHNDKVAEIGYYSLEGKTLEEVQKKSLQEWQADWKAKFK
jgi:hypothetical protein